MPVGLGHGTAHVEDELRELAMLMGLADPLAGEIHQLLEVLLGGECFRLEGGHLAGGSGRLVLGAATDHGPHRRIEAVAFGVVDILVASQPAVDRLAEKGKEPVLGILPGAGVVQAGRRGPGQSERVVEFPVSEESGVTGNGRSVELQFEVVVEIDSQGVLLAVTPGVPHPFRQVVVGNAGFSRVLAQIPCRKSRSIWEMWACSSLEARACGPGYSWRGSSGPGAPAARSGRCAGGRARWCAGRAAGGCSGPATRPGWRRPR
jgi:hypothetical protein